MLNTKDIDPHALYDADDIAVVFKVHRTTVHKQIFPMLITQRIGRKIRTSGDQLIKYATGEIANTGAE